DARHPCLGFGGAARLRFERRPLLFCLAVASTIGTMPPSVLCMSSPKPQRPQPFLSLRDGTFRLGDRLVFEHTSWAMDRQEHWAIIGANGSGKSLLADA